MDFEKTTAADFVQPSRFVFPSLGCALCPISVHQVQSALTSQCAAGIMSRVALPQHEGIDALALRLTRCEWSKLSIPGRYCGYATSIGPSKVKMQWISPAAFGGPGPPEVVSWIQVSMVPGLWKNAQACVNPSSDFQRARQKANEQHTVKAQASVVLYH